jgi:hypothetical protein
MSAILIALVVTAVFSAVGETVVRGAAVLVRRWARR